MFDENGKSKKFGFVSFADYESAKKAIEEMDQKKVLQLLYVNEQSADY